MKELGKLLALASCLSVGACCKESPAGTSGTTAGTIGAGTTAAVTSSSAGSSGSSTGGASATASSGSSSGVSASASATGSGGSSTGAPGSSSGGTGAAWPIVGENCDPGMANSYAEQMVVLPGPGGLPEMIFSETASPSPVLYEAYVDGGGLTIFPAADAGAGITSLSASTFAGGLQNTIAFSVLNGQDVSSTTQVDGGAWSNPTSVGLQPVNTYTGSFSVAYDRAKGEPWLAFIQNSPYGLFVEPFGGMLNPTSLPGEPQYMAATSCDNPSDGGSLICVVYTSGTAGSAQELYVAYVDPANPSMPQVDMLSYAGDAGIEQFEETAIVDLGGGSIGVAANGMPLAGGTQLTYVWASFSALPSGAVTLANADAPTTMMGIPGLVTWQGDPLLLGVGSNSSVVTGRADEAVSLGGSEAPQPPVGLLVGYTGVNEVPPGYTDPSGTVYLGLSSTDPTEECVGGTINLFSLAP